MSSTHRRRLARELRSRTGLPFQRCLALVIEATERGLLPPDADPVPALAALLYGDAPVPDADEAAPSTTSGEVPSVRVTISPASSGERGVRLTFLNLTESTQWLVKERAGIDGVQVRSQQVFKIEPGGDYLGRLVKRLPYEPDECVALDPGASITSDVIDLAELYAYPLSTVRVRYSSSHTTEWNGILFLDSDWTVLPGLHSPAEIGPLGRAQAEALAEATVAASRRYDGLSDLPGAWLVETDPQEVEARGHVFLTEEGEFWHYPDNRGRQAAIDAFSSNRESHDRLPDD